MVLVVMEMLSTISKYEFVFIYKVKHIITQNKKKIRTFYVCIFKMIFMFYLRFCEILPNKYTKINVLSTDDILHFFFFIFKIYHCRCYVTLDNPFIVMPSMMH